MLRSNFVLIGLIVLAVSVSLGVSFLIGRSDKGEINVNERIVNTDQSTLTKEVNAPSEPAKPNGGLNPQTKPPDDPAPNPAPEPAPAEEVASSTEEGDTPTESTDAETSESTDEAPQEETATE